jgi:hypothetical protein
MEKLKSITVGKKRFPYKIDMFVLEKLQEKYWDILSFELALKGLEVSRDKSGQTVYGADGKPILKKRHFSLKALNMILPLMVNEGLQIEADQKHESFEPVDEVEFIRGLEINPYELHAAVVEEFDRCFETKKGSRLS